MCKNTIQFKKGIGIMQFLANYGSEDQCENALFAWRSKPGSQNRGHKTGVKTGVKNRGQKTGVKKPGSKNRGQKNRGQKTGVKS